MIAIIDYGAGNIKSVQNALNRLGVDTTLTDNSEIIQAADKVIFPGVGEASFAMNFIRKKKLDEEIKSLEKPTLGICLGQQLMCSHSEEGNTEALGIFEEKVLQFPLDKGQKVPHMGWNNFKEISSPLLQGINISDDVYFVHSYYVEVGKNTIAETEYIVPFAAAMHKDNFWATQFHPEKSGSIGEKILENFLAL